MKGQLLPFVFLVLLVASVMIGYIYYNTFYGSEYQLNILNTRVIDAIRNIIEDFKSYVKLSLTYSTQQALREHACKGGLIGAGPWICNQPNPVEPDKSKQCLEKYTHYYLNVYASMFNSSLPVKISKANFTNLVYEVNGGDVFSGKYDEGNFWVKSSGAKITITSDNANEFENVDMNDYVTKNRYWYLFRNFYDWAMNDVYSPCICQMSSCSCGSGSSEQVCGTGCNNAAETCAQSALNDLQKRFDEYVKCDMKQACCAQGISSGYNDCGCKFWTNSICSSGCEHNCAEPPQDSICPVGSVAPVSQISYSAANPYSKVKSYKISFSSIAKLAGASSCCCFGGGGGGASCTSSCYYDCSANPCTYQSECYATTTTLPSTTTTQGSTTTTSGSTTTTGPITTTTIQSSNLCCIESRFSAAYYFWCIDYKYNVPSDKGPVPLAFKVTAIGDWRDPCGCGCYEC